MIQAQDKMEQFRRILLVKSHESIGIFMRCAMIEYDMNRMRANEFYRRLTQHCS